MRNQHSEDGVTPAHRALDDLAVIRRSRNDGDPPRELGQLVHADLAAHGDDLVTPVQRVPHHISPQLARGPDYADPQFATATCSAMLLRFVCGFSASGT